MRTEKEMLGLILKIAEDDKRIRTVILSGSRADPFGVCDEYSDFDIIYIVDNIRSFTNDDAWLDIFGDRLIMQKPADWYDDPYDYNGSKPFVYLMQFDDGNRVDLTLADSAELKKLNDNREPKKILLDKDGIFTLNNDSSAYDTAIPSEKEFSDCCNEFWWLTLSLSKAICRDEAVSIHFIMGCYEVDMLLKMLGWKAGAVSGFPVKLGKNYRYLADYLSKYDMSALHHLLSGSSNETVVDDFIKMANFFNEAAVYVSGYLDYIYDTAVAEKIIDHFSKTVSEKKR